MIRDHHAVAAALACLLALPGRTSAQHPAEQGRVDSLAAEVRALKARLDSMRAQLARRPAAAEAVADTSLAALRAAAAVAAGTDTTKMKADTAGPTKFVGGERSQPQLNPEISATGDVRAGARLEGIQRENFDAREFEVGFQSPLDPYSSTKIFVSFENGNVSIEEGYAYWTGLPGHIRFDIRSERSQPQLNPEISATGDVRAGARLEGIQRENFDAREFEVGFQSPLDPYSSTKIFVSFENGNVSIEEGYAYWTGLPGHIRFDI